MIQNKNYPDTKNRFEILENKIMQRKNLLFKSLIRLNKKVLHNKIIISMNESINAMPKNKFVYFH